MSNRLISPFRALQRRSLLATALSAALATTLALAGASASAQSAKPAQLRIGFQKSASLLTLQKAQGTLEQRLSPLGVAVKWVEFPAGPQLLEGLNVGAVDVGYVGEAPPIFAQAAGANFVYIGNDPAAPEAEAEAIVVPKDSALKSVADLRGKKVALNKGSNVHYLLVKALEKAGLKYSDIQPVFLPPADARAAFERGAVDAWVIWDPFLSAVEKQSGARQLADGRGVVNNYSYYLAERGYASQYPQVIQALFDDSVARGRWLKTHLDEAAALIAPLQGLDIEVVKQSLHRYQFNVQPLNASVAAEQQKIADTFADLKLIPKPIRIADALPGALPGARAVAQK
ncbi:sulfonate ABC transporter substrate-binding protein [Ideonella sp.]|uniref:sulfonate ABC transporter substrate-binding protein n=1 Tax=Ideonella sp. TaxID=1929293 RepID=UPI003BB57CF1